MATIRKDIQINASAGAVWDAVRDVGAVHERLTPGIVTRTVLDGKTRQVTFANGRTIREQIVTIDDTARRLAYAAIGGLASHHNASIEVIEEGPDRSRLVWITDVLPDDVVPPIRALVEQGAAAMKRTIEHDSSHFPGAFSFDHHAADDRDPERLV
jgi:Polyketide cyclase / dehydrase and lipid transport